MPASPSVRRLLLHCLAAALWGLTACAQLPTARVAVPPELSALPVTELPAARARSGNFTLPAALGSGGGRYTRAADRLSLFESLDLDRAALTLQLDGAADYRCTLRRTAAQIGVLALPVRPMQLRCRDAAADRRLELEEKQRSMRVERSGQFRHGALLLEIESLHKLQGSPLPLQEPAGYLLRHQGQAVAVLDLLGSCPRLQSGAPTLELKEAVRDAGLLLALHWDPASR